MKVANDVDLRAPKGTVSYRGRGTRYDLVPHPNGLDVLVLKSPDDAPNRVETSWIPRDPGLSRFAGEHPHARKLPSRAILTRTVAIVAANRLAERGAVTVPAQ
jgi:hypothetical protein